MNALITRRTAIGGAVASTATLVLPRYAVAAKSHPILDKFISVDTHGHPGALYRGGSRQFTKRALGNLKKSQLTAAVFSIVADAPVSGRRGKIERHPGKGELYRFTFSQLGMARRMVEDAGLPVITSPDELMTAKKGGTPGIIFAIEGGDFAVDRLEAIEEAYNLGVRIIQPGHNYPSGFADLQRQKTKLGGLSAEGKEFVQELNRLGIVVDTAHMTHAATRQTIETSSTPVIFSHTLYIKKSTGGRFIDAEHAKLIGNSGGVIGMWSMDHPQGTPSKKAYINAFQTFADLIGVDHVGMGNDLDSTSGWFDSYNDLPSFVDGLADAGFSEEEIGKLLGGNFLRVFKNAVERRTA